MARAVKTEIVNIGSIQGVILDYKDVVRLTARVGDDGAVHVNVPLHMTPETVIKTLLPAAYKLQAMLDDYKGSAKNKEDAFFLFGKRYSLVRTDNPKDAYISGDIFYMGSEAARDNFLCRELKRVLPGLIKECESRAMLHASGWTIKMMKSRWGSCNVATGAISLNGALAQYPIGSCKATIFHELTHLEHHGHGKDFYKALLSYYPEYYVWDKLLKAQRPDMNTDDTQRGD